MPIVALILGLVLFATALLWLFVSAKPSTIVAILRTLSVFAALAIAVLCAAIGRWGLAIAAGGVAFFLIWQFYKDPSRKRRISSDKGSIIRSAALEIELDPRSCELTGSVLTGTYEGKALTELGNTDLFVLLSEVSSDHDSVALLEAYLDRGIPGWRENFDGDMDPGSDGTSHFSAMSIDEAYEVLGLAPGASEAAVRKEHRRLVKCVHTGEGRSSFLSAKINEAKDRILSNHR